MIECSWCHVPVRRFHFHCERCNQLVWCRSYTVLLAFSAVFFVAGLFAGIEYFTSGPSRGEIKPMNVLLRREGSYTVTQPATSEEAKPKAKKP